MQAQPGKMFLSALPWFTVTDFFGSNGPALDVDALPYLFVDELIDVGTKGISGCGHPS